MKILGAGDRCGVAVMKPAKLGQASPLLGGPETIPQTKLRAPFTLS